jgi:hypothetical protein
VLVDFFLDLCARRGRLARTLRLLDPKAADPKATDPKAHVDDPASPRASPRVVPRVVPREAPPQRVAPSVSGGVEVGDSARLVALEGLAGSELVEAVVAMVEKASGAQGKVSADERCRIACTYILKVTPPVNP